MALTGWVEPHFRRSSAEVQRDTIFNFETRFETKTFNETRLAIEARQLCSRKFSYFVPESKCAILLLNWTKNLKLWYYQVNFKLSVIKNCWLDAYKFEICCLAFLENQIGGEMRQETGRVERRLEVCTSNLQEIEPMYNVGRDCWTKLTANYM